VRADLWARSAADLPLPARLVRASVPVDLCRSSAADLPLPARGADRVGGRSDLCLLGPALICRCGAVVPARQR